MMQIWYNIVGFLLPFRWIEAAFMKNALLAIILIMPLFALLGTMIINNRMAFFADALGHSAFAGIAIGGLVSITDPTITACAFGVLFAVLIVYIKNKSNQSGDTIISVFSSTAMALGIVIMSRGKWGNYSSYLIGDLLSIKPKEIAMLLCVCAVVLILWFFIFNKLLVSSVNKSLAKSRKINTVAIEMIFTATVALVVTLTVRWVGLLIISSMLVLPAAASRNVARNVRQYTVIAVVAALCSGVLGLVLAYYLNATVGATVVLVSAGTFFVSLLISAKSGGLN